MAKSKYKFSSLYRTNRKEYYRRVKISKAVKLARSNKRIIKEQKETKQYYRTLMQFNIEGLKKTGKYPISKVRVWINDTTTHTEQEVRQQFRDAIRMIKGFGVSVAKGKVIYNAEAIEIEEISQREADHVGKWQYYINIKGWEDEGII